ncbi:hypothetical protein [Lacticaseibacillus mingshuiensis]|uniref:Uncharacterized protein n=2 Tax=Lacticaseibacillus mingshuiensis TaxID=2799574 RepID=A0ABW4CK62_9LACO|nr:hypothetical protein [Lacticaseibacillus mingshuiensis]
MKALDINSFITACCAVKKPNSGVFSASQHAFGLLDETLAVRHIERVSQAGWRVDRADAI